MKKGFIDDTNGNPQPFKDPDKIIAAGTKC
jgi:hypothetical protein